MWPRAARRCRRIDSTPGVGSGPRPAGQRATPLRFFPEHALQPAQRRLTGCQRRVEHRQCGFGLGTTDDRAQAVCEGHPPDLRMVITSLPMADQKGIRSGGDVAAISWSSKVATRDRNPEAVLRGSGRAELAEGRGATQALKLQFPGHGSILQRGSSRHEPRLKVVENPLAGCLVHTSRRPKSGDGNGGVPPRHAGKVRETEETTAVRRDNSSVSVRGGPISSKCPDRP